MKTTDRPETLLGYSRNELARAAGISPTTVKTRLFEGGISASGAVINGERPVIFFYSEAQLPAICEALNVREPQRFFDTLAGQGLRAMEASCDALLAENLAAEAAPSEASQPPQP